MFGACSGGITSSAYTAWQAGRGESKVKNLILAVCTLDPSTAEDTALGALITPQTVEAARKASQLRGVLDGRDLAKVFAWMRPNDLIWNYWVNNYLLGNAPPAFDILYWNSDTTSLPARLHSDYLDLIILNPFRNPGALTISGTPIDMGKVKPRRLCRRRFDRPHHAMEVRLSDGQDSRAKRPRSSCRTRATCRASSTRPETPRRRS